MYLINRFFLVLIISFSCFIHAIDGDFIITQTNIDGGLTIDQAGVWCFNETTTFVESTGIIITVTGVTLDLQGYNFEGAEVGTNAIQVQNIAQVIIQNGTIKDCLGEGVSLVGTHDITLNGLIINNTGSNGIHVADGCHDGVIKNCAISNVAGEGIYIENSDQIDVMNSSVVLADSNGIHIDLNTADIACEQCSTTSATNAGFLVEGTDVIIHLCTAKHTLGEGVGYAIDGTSVSVINGYALENAGAGYEIAGSNNAVKYSYIYGNDDNGITIQSGATDNQIIENRLQANGGYGIQSFCGTSNSVHRNNVSQNVLGGFYRVCNLP